jgi:hypothetical protein
VPQGSRKSNDDREYLDWGPRENWPKAISFYSDNTTLHLEWAAAGTPHLFATYPGGHSLSVWARWAPLWLGRVLAYLRAPA